MRRWCFQSLEAVQLVLEPWQGLPNRGLWKQGVPLGSRSLVKGSATTKKLLEAEPDREKYPGSSLPFTHQSLSSAQLEACEHRSPGFSVYVTQPPVPQNRAGKQ